MPGLKSNETLYVTHAKGKVHITACPHLFKHSKLVEASAEQVEENGLCSHCEKELRGEGRTYFDDLEEALRGFGHRTDEAKRLIREALGGVGYDTIWVPSSTSYIALGADGQGVAWIGQGYVAVKGQPVVELPWFQGPRRRWRRPQRRGHGRHLRGPLHREVAPRRMRDVRLSGECPDAQPLNPCV